MQTWLGQDFFRFHFKKIQKHKPKVYKREETKITHSLHSEYARFNWNRCGIKNSGPIKSIDNKMKHRKRHSITAKLLCLCKLLEFFCVCTFFHIKWFKRFYKYFCSRAFNLIFENINKLIQIIHCNANAKFMRVRRAYTHIDK